MAPKPDSASEPPFWLVLSKYLVASFLKYFSPDGGIKIIPRAVCISVCAGVGKRGERSLSYLVFSKTPRWYLLCPYSLLGTVLSPVTGKGSKRSWLFQTPCLESCKCLPVLIILPAFCLPGSYAFSSTRSSPSHLAVIAPFHIWVPPGRWEGGRTECQIPDSVRLPSVSLWTITATCWDQGYHPHFKDGVSEETWPRPTQPVKRSFIQL